jgi:hypothetical protein
VRRRRNSSSDLIDYQSKVSVGGQGLSGFEATLILGGLLAVGGLVAYAMLKNSTSSVAAVAAPPVQPVPYNPSQPGY